MRAEITAAESDAAGAPVTAGAEPGVAELLTELASAGLVSVEMSDDGEVSYALTPQGQLSARLMAMSRHPHALVLLGALASSSDEPN